MAKRKVQVDLKSTYDNKGIKGLEKDLKELNKKVDGVVKNLQNDLPKGTDSVDKLSGSIFNLANAFKLVIASKITKTILNLGTSVLNASSNMTELENVTNQVFGNMSKEVEAFAKQMGSEMGRSIYDMKKYISDMGAVLKGLGGLNDSKIKEMSQNLATLAVDIGSFKNIDDSQAFNALRGGIVGETEALKTLGIVINDTVMKEYALKQGIKAKWETLDATTKAQLRYQAILEKTTFMQGDAARTINSYANQLKVFQANTNNLAVTIGNKLVPAATGFLKNINSIVEATDKWLNKKKVSDYIGEFAVAKIRVEDLAKEYNSLEKVTDKTATQQKRMSDIVDELITQFPDHADNIKEEIKLNGKLKTSINGVIESLKEKAKAELIASNFGEQMDIIKKYESSNSTRSENISKNKAKLVADYGINLSDRAFTDKTLRSLMSAAQNEQYKKGRNKRGVNDKLYEYVSSHLFKYGYSDKKLSVDEMKKAFSSLYDTITSNESVNKSIDNMNKELGELEKKYLKESQKLDNELDRIKIPSTNILDSKISDEKIKNDAKIELEKANAATKKLANEVKDKTKKFGANALQTLKAKKEYEENQLEILQLNSQLYGKSDAKKMKELSKSIAQTGQKISKLELNSGIKNTSKDDKEKIKKIAEASYADIVSAYGKNSIQAFEKRKQELENAIKEAQVGASKDPKKAELVKKLEAEKAGVEKAINELMLNRAVAIEQFGTDSKEAIEAEIKDLQNLLNFETENLKNGGVKTIDSNEIKARIKMLNEKLEEMSKVPKTKIQMLNEAISNFNSKQDLIELNSSDLKIDFREMYAKVKEKFENGMKLLIDKTDTDSKFSNLEDLSVEKVTEFLISLGDNFEELSDLDKEKVEQAKKLLKERMEAEKKAAEEEKKRKKEMIETANNALSTINQFLNELANLFPENKELQEATKKVAGFLGDMGNIGLGIGKAVIGDPQGIQQAIQGGLSLIFKVVGTIIDVTKDFSKEVEQEFSKRGELDKNLSSFNNLRNAIRDLTDTIIESTSKLATDANIAQNKEIFKELNQVYANKGIDQDVVVNGSYLRQNGIKNTVGRAILALYSFGLSELVPLKKSKFSKTYKLEDFVDVKGKNSKELKYMYKHMSDEKLSQAIYKKTHQDVATENNWSGVARVDLKDFKDNTKELKEKWLEYIKQIEEQEKQVEEFNKNVIKESLDGISVVDVNKEKKQILGYYKNIITDEKEYNRVLPDLEKKVEELLKSKSEIVSAFNDVRINTMQQLSGGNDTLSSLAIGTQSYFNKIRNNIAKIQLESKNGIFQGLDEEMNAKFSDIANQLVKIRLEGKNVSNLKIDFKDQFAKMKQLSKINNETIEIVKKLREQALSEGIDISLVDKMLPLGEAQKRALDISNIMKTAMTASLETNSFNQFSMSLGDSLYKHVKESLIQAFTDSEKYQKLIKKYVVTEDFDKEIDKADSLRGAYDIIKNQLTKAEDMLKAQGLDFRGTNTNTGEYLGGSLQNKIGMSNNFGTLATSGFTVNVNTTITNNGFLSVDDLTNSLIDKTKTKLNFDKQREV